MSDQRKPYPEVFESRPFLPLLRELGVELDQRLRQAFVLSATHGPEDVFYDSHVFHALLRLNSTLAITNKIESAIHAQSDNYRKWLWLAENKFTRNVETMIAHDVTRRVVHVALQIRQTERTLGTGDFLKAIAIQTKTAGDEWGYNRPFTTELLAELFSGSRYARLDDASEVREYLKQLENTGIGADDFQYVVAMSGDRIVFRPFSVLGDYIHQTDSGLLAPKRAVLCHFRDNFGGFLSDEIEELEELLNADSAKEQDFQLFFERHPHFFRKWDYREIHPHVVLSSEDTGDLIPDFLLTDRELQKAAILDLKLPVKIVRRQKNRDRFGAAVTEARTQLLRYRDWFEEKSNREQLKAKIGMEIFRPRLSVIIGRTSDFVDAIDRQRLSADNPDLEIVTYDDLLSFAKRRRLIVQGDI